MPLFQLVGIMFSLGASSCASSPAQKIVPPDMFQKQVAVSPDGRWIAVGGGTSEKGTVSLLEMKSRRVIRTLSDQNLGAPETLTFTSDSQMLFVTDEHHLVAWEAPTWKRKHFLPRIINTPASGVHVASVSPDGSTFLNGHDRRVDVWDIKKKKIVRTWNWVGVFTCKFSADGKYLLVYGNGVQLRNAHSGQLIRSVNDDASYYELSDDSKKLLSISENRGLETRALTSNKLLAKAPNLKKVFEYGYPMAVSPNGKFLAVGDYRQARTHTEALSLNYHVEGQITIWDMQKGTLVKTVPQFNSGVTSLEW